MTCDEELSLSRVLRHYAVDPDRSHVDLPSHARGFSGALIARVQTDDATYCLRRLPSRALPHRRILALHRFLGFLHVEGLDVLPVPIPARDGGTLVAQDGDLWQLEPWMPGVADFAHAPTDVRRDAVMQLLARLHCVAARYEPTDAGRVWFATYASQPSPAIGERMAAIDRWPSARVNQAFTIVQGDHQQLFREVAEDVLNHFRASHARVRSELLRVSQSPVRLHPCLRDVWHDHVLFMGDEVTGLIDPSATRSESVASDLSRLLGSLLGGDCDERWGRALETYARIRPLSTAEHQLIRVLHVSGTLLSGMTWIDRRLTGRINHEVLPRVVSRLDAIRRTLSCL